MTLFLFDMDGTLISNYMDRPDKAYDRWEVLPGRVEKLRDLIERGNRVRIITNQGGVAFGFIPEAMMWDKLGAALRELHLQPVSTADDWGRELVYVCYHDTRGTSSYNDPIEAARRKPSGAMIREAMVDYPDDAQLGVLYVGDREEDLQAAQDAGVGFQWSHIFFKES